MPRTKLRCAIYTRKSTEEGLDQEFNYLDAQYEACRAYIKSQKQEGWIEVKTRYDDGGYSGGTLKRPALAQLLGDVEQGQIDQIIVYKIDRLTRSLSDFSKIVEKLEAHDAGFVSVTQSFNTATSMGRLTLNMLLSFAQFEREVTGEPIRDKIAASKAKGMWMGGTIPLGYKTLPDQRGLVVDVEQARTVMRIFELYDALKNVAKVECAAAQEGLSPKRKCGTVYGAFSRGALHKLLTNPIYIGKIKHKDKLHDGQHLPIIPEELWDRVQAKLAAASAKRKGPHVGTDCAILKGKLFDETGDRLTPTHTKNAGRKIRYYLSNRLIRGKDPTGWRLNADQLEMALAEALKDEIVKRLTEGRTGSLEDIKQAREQAQDINHVSKDALLSQIARIDLGPDALEIKLVAQNNWAELFQDCESFKLPLKLKKRGVEQKLILNNHSNEPDQKLIETLAMSVLWLNDLKAGSSMAEIAKAHGRSRSFIRSRLKLAFLSPKIKRAILLGKQPPHLTATFIANSQLPGDWQEQEKLFEFE